jgi:uncharacterized protein YjbI with pentapeptide repeats
MQKLFALSLSFCRAAIHLPNARAEVAVTIETATKVQFNSEPGKTYQVYATTNVNKTEWAALGAPQSGSGEEITFFHTTTGDQKVFFKVEETNGVPVAPSGGTPLSLLQRARLNLQGQDLSGLVLTNLDLNNFMFAFAKFKGADLSGSKFTDANLGDADFSNARLVGADLYKGTGSAINFSGADLRNATLGGQAGEFQNANLSGGKIVGIYITSGTFHNTIARGLIAKGVTIAFYQTDGADFTGSDFSRAGILHNTSFAGANLTGAKFINTVFSADAPPQPPPPAIQVPFPPVPFNNANLTDADLTGAKNFFDAPGIIYKNTKLPNGTIRTDP